MDGALLGYTDSGHIVTGDFFGGEISVAPFDPDEGELVGPPQTLIEHTRSGSLSADGSRLVYVHEPILQAEGMKEMVWVSRSGEVSALEHNWQFRQSEGGFGLSPDGKKLVLDEVTTAVSGVWVKDLETGLRSRLTFHDSEHRKARWAPDGRSVTFLSDRGGDLALWSKPADGTGRAEPLADFDGRVASGGWSPDGAWLLLRTAGPPNQSGGRDVLALRPAIDRVPVPLLASEFDEADPRFPQTGAGSPMGPMRQAASRYTYGLSPTWKTDAGRCLSTEATLQNGLGLGTSSSSTGIHAS